MTPQEYEQRYKMEVETRDEVMVSFLMPTIPERATMYSRLRDELDRQIAEVNERHPTLGKAEVIRDGRIKYKDGGPNIGSKRQALLDKAKGMYVCFLDDDETIAPNYAETILRLAYTRPDIGTFSSVSKMDNFWCVVVMRLGNTENQQAFPGIVNRRPWHMCPVRREIAKRHKFPESNYGEDWVWFDKVLRDCHVENNTTAIIHQYNHDIKVSEADNISTSIG